MRAPPCCGLVAMRCGDRGMGGAAHGRVVAGGAGRRAVVRRVGRSARGALAGAVAAVTGIGAPSGRLNPKATRDDTRRGRVAAPSPRQLGAGGSLPRVLGVAGGTPATHPPHFSALPAATGRRVAPVGKTPRAWMPVRPAAPADMHRHSSGQQPDDTRGAGARGCAGSSAPIALPAAASRGSSYDALAGKTPRAWMPVRPAAPAALTCLDVSSLKLARPARRNAAPAGAFSGVAA